VFSDGCTNTHVMFAPLPTPHVSTMYVRTNIRSKRGSLTSTRYRCLSVSVRDTTVDDQMNKNGPDEQKWRQSTISDA